MSDEQGFREGKSFNRADSIPAMKQSRWSHHLTPRRSSARSKMPRLTWSLKAGQVVRTDQRRGDL